MNENDLRKIIKEEIENALTENVGDILGYAALAIILGGSAYITYFNKMKGDISQRTNSTELNPFMKKILNKIAPDWTKNREIRKIAEKLSKIPEVMELVNTPYKTGLRELVWKYLAPEEQQYVRDLTRHVIKKSAGEIKEIAPSPSMKGKFPYINSYDADKQGSKMVWNIISVKKMDKKQIEEFQGLAGYAPQGYGGPFDFKEDALPDGIFKYTWFCFSSSN